MPNVLTDSDMDYYRSRMAAELALAASADNAQVSRAHHKLAARYERMIAAVPDNDSLDDELLSGAYTARPTRPVAAPIR